MTSTRILARRRLGAAAVTAHVSAPPRRRRRTRGFVQVAGAVASERLRLNVLGHAYFLIGAGVIVLLFYLAIAAQITQSSYDIARLQDQQRQLIAEQDQLRYQEVTMHAPAQIQQQATQSGMVHMIPSRFVAGHEVAVDLSAPVGNSPADATPLWMRMVAFVLNTAGGSRDVLAASKK